MMSLAFSLTAFARRCAHVAQPGVLGLGLAVVLIAAVPLRGLDSRTAMDGYLLQEWQTEHGLPSNKVRALCRTRDGYLWMASPQGVARFDGYRFEIFNRGTNPELGPGNFPAMMEDNQGNLWIGSATGLFKWVNGRFQRYTKDDGLIYSSVRSLSQHRDGTIVIGTGQGLTYLRDGKFTPMTAWKEIESNVRSYVQMANGVRYIGAERGFWRVEGDKIVRLSGTPEFPGTTYGALLEDPDGSLWVGSNVGLHHLHADGRVETFTEAQGLTNLRVQSLKRDRDGNLWIGTTAGLFCMRNNRIEASGHPAELGAATVVDFCEDPDGALWIATFTGLYRLTNPTFRSVGVAQGLDHTRVYSVIESQDGSWLIGTWGGGLFRYDGMRASPVTLPSGFKVDQIAMLHEEPNGALWIGAYSGFYLFEDGKITPFSVRSDDRIHRQALQKNPDYILPGILHTRANAMVPHRDGGYWVGSNNALYRVDEQRGFHTMPAIKGAPAFGVRSVVHGRDGAVWTSNGAHVVRYRGSERTHQQQEMGLATDRALHLYEDSAGSIWLTSEGDGLFRFKDGRWDAFTTREGLVDDFISCIIEDDLGFLWIGTARGMMRIARTAFDELRAGRAAHLRPQVFTRFDGMPVTETSNASSANATKTRDGRLLFATDLGVAYVDPKRISPNPKPPLVHIERMHVSGQPVVLGQGLELPPDHSDVAFEYTAISLAAPEKVRFKVRLSPIETEWHDSGSRRDVRYTRLPYGKYTLEVIAGNNDGIWNEKAAVQEFTVRPFFHQTWWFRAGGILMLGLSVAGVIRWRLALSEQRSRALSRQNLELERGIAERTAELAKSYEALRSSEYFYHSLVESMPWVIVRKNAEGRFTYANSAFADLVGKPLSEIIGKSEEEVYGAERAAKSRADDLKVMQTRQPIEYENVVERENAPKRYLHVKKVPLYDEVNRAIGVQVFFWDMTVFRETEEKLKQAQSELIATSRLAGIAEVATGVLHNIGNALNSVNTSASVIEERIRDLKVPSLSKVVRLLLENQARLVEFLSSDPRGRQVPNFLEKLAEQLETDRSGMLEEIEDLRLGIEQIRHIVAAQQGHARVSDAAEAVAPVELVEYALRLTDASFHQNGVNVVRDFMAVPPVRVPRQKALQILVNLVRNASQALEASSRPDRLLTVAVREGADAKVEFRIIDNGVGIPPENLTRIFAFGFTTKKDGHGFGLHTSALAAKEMGGALVAESEGLGKGATFVLSLPAEREVTAPSAPNPAADVVSA